MNKRTRIGILASLALAALLPLAARADMDTGTPHIVLIGIDKFQDAQIKSRKHAEADAKALYELFTNKDYLGVAKDNIKLLLGTPGHLPAQPATRANILKALDWVADNAKKDDLVIVGYFGNGAPLGERSCYFAVDSTFKNRAKDAVASGDIGHILDKVKSRRFVALVDCNFLGFDAGKGPAPDPNIGNFYREFLGGEDGSKETISRVVFLANSGLKPSLNLKDHGVFAEILIRGLSGAADREGYEADGNITIGELAKFVREEMPKLAREMGKSEEDKSQLPVVLEGQAADFLVDLNPAVHPRSVKRLRSFDALAKEKKVEKEILEEGQNLLSRMPKLEAQQSLRKAYQKLADGDIDLAGFLKSREEILESTRLGQREADNFALTVMKATRLVRNGFVRDVPSSQLVDYAIRGMFKEVSEKIPSTLKEKLDNIKGAKEVDLLKLLAESRKHLGKREDLGNGKDITAALHYMLTKLDKHTDYLDPETVRRFETDTRGSFFGIGVQIRKNSTKDLLQVVTPIRGSPAYNAKIQAGDLITTIIREVDNEGNKLPEPEVISTKGMTTEEAVKKIIGKEGTEVKLLIEREGNAKPLEFKLIRGRVEVESVMGYKRTEGDDWNYLVDPENKICYVRLTQFSSNTARDLESIMKKLAKVGIKGFVLDLRFNPGGLLDQAVKISDLFIDDGLIVTIRPRNGPETSYIGKGDGSYLAFPMVCLVNGGSASASEIVSACLQDHTRAVIIGTRSYGKGSVQTIHRFVTGGVLKLTTASFWRPNGKNLNRSSTAGRDEDEWGVTPDFLVKVTKKQEHDLQDWQREQEIILPPGKRKSGTEAKADFRDEQLERALDYLRSQIRTASQRTPAPFKKG